MVASIIELFIFVVSTVLFFYLPGKFLVLKLQYKLSFLEDIFFSSAIGIMFFTLLLYIVGWIYSWVLSIPILLGVIVLTLRSDFLPRGITRVDRIAFFLTAVITR